MVVGIVVFDGIAPQNYPLEYMCMPFLLWVAFRFGPREAATSTLVLAATAIWGTLHGVGPFARPSPNESLLLVQTFISVVGITTMGLATAFAERRLAEEQSHYLAVSDPLTGLGNYRKLIDTLEMEIRRSTRTGRAFGLLLLDLDDLKRLNDTHGHVVGSRALCRLAKVLRLDSRNIDTAARYGGDEFALIIPELGPDLGHELWQEYGLDDKRLPPHEAAPREREIGERIRRGENVAHVDRAAEAGLSGVPGIEPLGTEAGRERRRRASDAAARAQSGGQPGAPDTRQPHEILADFKAEATARAIQHISQRISNHLANDGEFPHLSVSIGAAQFPADGENIEQLLNAADQALYRNKRARKTRVLAALGTQSATKGSLPNSTSAATAANTAHSAQGNTVAAANGSHATVVPSAAASAPEPAPESAPESAPTPAPAHK
jgi:GGDEF domain-containing protein